MSKFTQEIEWNSNYGYNQFNEYYIDYLIRKEKCKRRSKIINILYKQDLEKRENEKK